MRAAVVDEIPALGIRITELPDLTPDAPDDVVLRIEACGICGTDLHILDGFSYRPATFPFVLGHEPVGVVVDAGRAARHWIGRRVTITLFAGCGACERCVVGDQRLCQQLRFAVGAIRHWGAFAELLVVPASQLVDVPAALSSAEVASLVDAGATAANAVRAIDRAVDRPVVVGGGPVGFFVAELLRHHGYQPVVVQRPGKRAEVLAGLGYLVVGTLDEGPAEPDVIVDCSGDGAVLPLALARIGARGLIVAAAYAVIPSLDTAPISRKELTFRGVRSGSRQDLVRMLDLAASRADPIPSS